jgi:cell wall assembly regulator SMI1
MLTINLTQGILTINGTSVVFPIEVDTLIDVLGVCRVQKTKYNDIFTWDQLGITAYSKRGGVVESLLVGFRDQEYIFSPKQTFSGVFMFEGVEILSYREANKEKLIKLFSADEGKAFASGSISVWFGISDDVVEDIQISEYKPKEIPKALSIDASYTYLEPLWQEWIEEITKVVPTNNRYYNLTHGITEEDINNYSCLEEGIHIPEELINFYKIRNVEYDGVASAFGFSTHYYEYDLIPFKNIVSEWENIQNLQFGDSLEESNLEGYSPKVKADDYTNSKWIPFAEGHDGDYLLYDTDPSEEGKYGQIVELQNESWERNIVADSFVELLQNEIDALKNGNTQKFNFILDK